jgi:hypothetical protein
MIHTLNPYFLAYDKPEPPGLSFSHNRTPNFVTYRYSIASLGQTSAHTHSAFA